MSGRVRANLGHRQVEFRAPSARHENGRAFDDELFGGGQANAGAATGDDRDLGGQKTMHVPGTG